MHACAVDFLIDLMDSSNICRTFKRFINRMNCMLRTTDTVTDSQPAIRTSYVTQSPASVNWWGRSIDWIVNDIWWMKGRSRYATRMGDHHASTNCCHSNRCNETLPIAIRRSLTKFRSFGLRLLQSSRVSMHCIPAEKMVTMTVWCKASAVHTVDAYDLHLF